MPRKQPDRSRRSNPNLKLGISNGTGTEFKLKFESEFESSWSLVPVPMPIRLEFENSNAPSARRLPASAVTQSTAYQLSSGSLLTSALLGFNPSTDYCALEGLHSACPYRFTLRSEQDCVQCTCSFLACMRTAAERTHAANALARSGAPTCTKNGDAYP